MAPEGSHLSVRLTTCRRPDLRSSGFASAALTVLVDAGEVAVCAQVRHRGPRSFLRRQSTSKFPSRRSAYTTVGLHGLASDTVELVRAIHKCGVLVPISGPRSVATLARRAGGVATAGILGLRERWERDSGVSLSGRASNTQSCPSCCHLIVHDRLSVPHLVGAELAGRRAAAPGGILKGAPQGARSQ